MVQAKRIAVQQDQNGDDELPPTKRKREKPKPAEFVETRLGRKSYPPLAFWRKERVVQDSKSGLSTVVRVQEAMDTGESRSGCKSKPHPLRTTNKRKRNSGDHPERTDSWEQQEGRVISGVISWRNEYDSVKHPPAIGDKVDAFGGKVDVTTEVIAVAGQAIETRYVDSSSFRMASFVDMRFLKAGMIDLLPGEENPSKNSGIMRIVFVMVSGKGAWHELLV